MDSNQGYIFHIIHGSFVDGYGIRTTVFLKGCPLRCLWCCNPEGQAAGQPELKFALNLCDGCGRCVKICPTKAIKLSTTSTGKVEIDRSLCNSCGECLNVCYPGALEFFGKLMTVDEVFDIVRRDEPFYRSSGGGVTIGGGEPTFQPQFVRALIKKFKNNYIHVALDTCGYTTSAEGVQALGEVDLLLFDLKGIDDNGHLKNTFVSNKRILENIALADTKGIPIIIRMPLIPGLNNSQQNIENAGKFLSKLKNVERVDLLPYHEYGAEKHRQLGKIYSLHLQAPSQEELMEIKTILSKYNIKSQVGG